MCNTCVQNNQLDRVLDQIASTREKADIEPITQCLEVKQELAQIKNEVKAKPPPEPTKAHIPAWVKPQNQSISERNNGVKENYDGIRLRGITESKAGTGGEQYDEDVEQVERIFIFLAVKNCPIDDVKRIRTYDQNKNRTILVKVSNDHQRRKILLSAHKMATYEKRVYISQELNSKEKQTENEILQLRRSILDYGVSPRELRIRQLRLKKRIDNKRVFIDNKEESKHNDLSLEFDWLENTKPKIKTLFLNVRSLLDFNRRQAFTNEIAKLGWHPLPNQNLADRLQTGSSPLPPRIRKPKQQYFCIYSPPINSPYRASKNNLEVFLNEIKNTAAEHESTIVITNDLNRDTADWESMKSKDTYEKNVVRKRRNELTTNPTTWRQTTLRRIAQTVTWKHRNRPNRYKTRSRVFC